MRHGFDQKLGEPPKWFQKGHPQKQDTARGSAAGFTKVRLWGPCDKRWEVALTPARRVCLTDVACFAPKVYEEDLSSHGEVRVLF